MGQEVGWWEGRKGDNSRSRQRDISQVFKNFASLSKQLKKVIHDSNTTLAELQTSGSLDLDEGTYLITIGLGFEVCVE